MSDEQRLVENLLRPLIGLEHTDDLIADLDQALQAARTTSGAAA